MNKKDLDPQDCRAIKKALFEKGKDVQEAKGDLHLVRQRRELGA